MKCICDWDMPCSGTGVVHCRGCGGDQCICQCGGERPCNGCTNCEQPDSYRDFYEADDDDNA